MFFKRRKTPFCTAPFTSVVVDPNKGVRPCCTFQGHLGNLEDESLRGILTGKAWKALQEDVNTGVWPEGCVNCLEREAATGWSVRTMYMQEARSIHDGSWRKGLTELEVNSSSICNLACTHCSTEFSSRWVQELARLEAEGVPHHRTLDDRVFKPDPQAIVREISALDLRHLQIARFKGGEPMLSPDVPAVLRHLRERRVLERVTVNIVSNGTSVNADVLELLRGAQSVHMVVSVDGPTGVQEYIRHGPSGIDRIEGFIAAFAALERISFSMSVSVMAYNVFSLDRIADWWNRLGERHPGKLNIPHRFSLHVVSPAILALNVLQDATRQPLLEKYGALANADYGSVLTALHQPFAGARLHDEFVAYTRGVDRLHGTDVLAVIPELAAELAPLDSTATGSGPGRRLAG